MGGSGGLVGREAEQKQISTFLRSAISSVNPKGDGGGNGGGSNVTFSLFVAGLPGKLEFQFIAFVFLDVLLSVRRR